MNIPISCMDLVKDVQLSGASNRSQIFFTSVKVRVSQAYKNTDITRERISFHPINQEVCRIFAKMTVGSVVRSKQVAVYQY